MSPPVYLRRLLARFHSLGGKLHRVHLSGLQDVVSYLTSSGNPPPQAIVVCASIGARTLGGVSDAGMFPTRGQVLVLAAPWCKTGWTWQVGSLAGGEGGTRTYVIPRQEGVVIVGGTREVDDWYVLTDASLIARAKFALIRHTSLSNFLTYDACMVTNASLLFVIREQNARPETSIDILRRALLICPSLAPPAVRLEGREPSYSDLLPLIRSEVVGFRPSRKAGLRLKEGEPLVVRAEVDEHRNDRTNRTVRVVYNYGHGGFGWQSCWGCAEEVVETLGGKKVPRVSQALSRAAGLDKNVSHL